MTAHPELFERAEAARIAIDNHCIEQRFFAYRLSVPGAQLSSTPFFCIAVVPRGDSKGLTFYFSLDEELNIFRPGNDVLDAARECIAHAVASVPGIAILEHRIDFRHVGIPPVAPESLPCPPACPALTQPPEVDEREAASIASAFFADHLEKHDYFVEPLREQIPWLESDIPVRVEHVFWVPPEQKLVVYVRFDDEDIDPWNPPDILHRLFDDALERLRTRHPETARYPVRVFFQK